MTISAEYREYVLDLLSGAGNVTARSMFGGAGLYLDGTMFALIASDVLYFKVDDGNRVDYEDAGSAPFVPFSDKPFPMSYWEVPPDLMEDPEELCRWAHRAWEAARRSKTGKKRTGRKR